MLAGCALSPQPLSEREHWARSQADRAELFEDQESPQQPISLAEAVARTLKYNLDHRLAQMERVYAYGQLDAAQWQMLPKLAVNGGYSMRSNESASSSISFETRRPTLEPSMSSERRRFNGDISFSWSLLDFGLGYFQAKQQADRYLIMNERRRRIVNNLVKEVLAAYCHLASMEEVAPQVEAAVREAGLARAALHEMERTRAGSLQHNLEQQRVLVSTLGRLRQLSQERAMARTRLAALMNLPLAAPFETAPFSPTEAVPPDVSAPLAELEAMGLYLRPDLREEDYLERVDRHEVKKEMLRLIPGLNAFGGGNYDSNRYLVNEFWAEAGVRMTMDLLGTVGRYKNVRSARSQLEVAKARRLAASVAALVQIHIGYHEFAQARAAVRDAQELDDIERKLLDLSAAAASARAAGRLEEVLQSLSRVNARLDRNRRAVEALSAWANLYFSVGGDILTDVDEAAGLADLTAQVDGGLRRWLSGRLPDGYGVHAEDTPAALGMRPAAPGEIQP